MKNFLTARWEQLIMANYAVDPALLQAHLPKDVALDLYEGKAYISLVGFMFKNTRIFHIPIPKLGTFEEVNLRFYVTRKEGNELKRGVVFISETVPYKVVAWLANKLYKEHYVAIPTKHSWKTDAQKKHIEYQWKMNKKWSRISVEASIEKRKMQKNSMEEFIFEHYYGYTKIDVVTSEEYKINHPSWFTNDVLNYTIHCDFEEVYGSDFKFLNDQTPASVMLAEGSEIAVKWKRNRF
jgi:uncharacterized protein